jgi:hypothetical protein
MSMSIRELYQRFLRSTGLFPPDPPLEAQLVWCLFLAADQEPPNEIARVIGTWARLWAPYRQDACEAIQLWHSVCSCDLCTKRRAGYS